MTTYASLFSGIEGIGLGLEAAGMTPLWRCEIDGDCRRVLARHWPDVPIYPDVKEISDSAPRVDVLCGGFPCQDVSVAGRRAGLAGARSGLFHEFMRVAAALTPRWVLIENVPGLLSSCGCPDCRPDDDGDQLDDEEATAARVRPDHRGRDMAIVVGTLGQLGYGWAYRVLDAQYLGVAQRRRRVFIVGCAGDAARAAQVLFEPESCDADSPPRRETGTRTAACLTAGVATGRGVNPPGRRQEDDVNIVPVVAALTANGVGTCGADDNQGQAGHLIPTLALTLEAGRGQRNDPTHQTFLPTACPVDLRNGVIGDEDEVVGTLQSHHASYSVNAMPHVAYSTSGATLTATAILTPMAVRRLTPLECERLQGFPDGWTDQLSDSARYRALGNAVAVPCSTWIGRRIAQALAA